MYSNPIVLQYQGDDFLDADIPTRLEAKLFCTTFGKFIWVCLQPFFYALRPLFVNPKVPQKLEYLNTAIQLTFDAFIVYYFGTMKNPALYKSIGRACAVESLDTH